MDEQYELALGQLITELDKEIRKLDSLIHTKEYINTLRLLEAKGPQLADEVKLLEERCEYLRTETPSLESQYAKKLEAMEAQYTNAREQLERELQDIRDKAKGDLVVLQTHYDDTKSELDVSIAKLEEHITELEHMKRTLETEAHSLREQIAEMKEELRVRVNNLLD